jgi:hypothetical protein
MALNIPRAEAPCLQGGSCVGSGISGTQTDHLSLTDGFDSGWLILNTLEYRRLLLAGGFQVQERMVL